MIQKNPCVICSKHIPPETSDEKHEARLCQKHAQNFQCLFCKKLHPSSPPAGQDLLPLFICSECWLAGGGTETRCSAFSLE